MARMKGGMVVVLMTCDRQREARSIAAALVRTRAAACVSVYPRGDSLYWWKGVMERAREHLLIAKTRRSSLPALIGVVRSIHNYEVPEIVALPIAGGSREYLGWLKRETACPRGTRARKGRKNARTG